MDNDELFVLAKDFVDCVTSLPRPIDPDTMNGIMTTFERDERINSLDSVMFRTFVVGLLLKKRGNRS